MMEEILEYFGGVTNLSRVMGVRQPAVSQWIHNGIPAKRAIQIEEITKGKFKAVDIIGERD